jgi:hypothetical protein
MTSVLQSRLARVPDSRYPETISVSDDGELELSDYADHRDGLVSGSGLEGVRVADGRFSATVRGMMRPC